MNHQLTTHFIDRLPSSPGREAQGLALGNQLLLQEIRQFPVSMERPYPLRQHKQSGGLELVPQLVLRQVRGRPLQGTVDEGAECEDKQRQGRQKESWRGSYCDPRWQPAARQGQQRRCGERPVRGQC